ncbi:DUF4870 domain-containing protein [Chitinilyticum piscinae]|uniref:DUF4870 domain-containing protein n=1 Tax=Chitinilyticum piscinae TaxID=2866724 RepID=A0A8J7G2W9_9NEIS|nr:DUF4870 domain-containing protein [Chitinilyticum piscinae]MBE9610358.1 DUF4870 domain-containing protein [Chitinilyticum piscinae]
MSEELQTGLPTPASKDSTNMALLVWLGTLFFGFLVPLIMFLVKKDDEFVLDASKEALNWSITAFIGYIAGAILSIILVGFLVMFAVGIAHLVFCILGAVAASKGQAYRLPYNLRLIK